MMDVLMRFLVNTGKTTLILSMRAQASVGGGAIGRLAGSQQAGYTPEESRTRLWSRTSITDHVGGDQLRRKARLS